LIKERGEFKKKKEKNNLKKFFFFGFLILFNKTNDEFYDGFYYDFEN
jgi:hypothetical protein